jgi:hypothetical protein
VAAAIVLALGARGAGAYSTYAGCDLAGCHGGFEADPYRLDGVDQGWGTDLMAGHQFAILGGFVGGACDVCHSAGGFGTVSTFSSVGVGGEFTTSCLGCHGRFEDGLGSPESSGLRQLHWEAGIQSCGSCHPDDSNPALYMPVGEDVLPPNYDLNLSLVSLTDPCNPGGVGEDFAGDSGGLDNDGDSQIDELDSDCMPTPTPTPSTMPRWPGLWRRSRRSSAIRP